MLRQRLVRQTALSSADAPSLEGYSQGRPGLFRPVSSESFERLVDCSPVPVTRRRHSVASLPDAERTPFKSAFSSAVKKMSTACSYLVSTSQNAPGNSPESPVVLPPVLDTFRPGAKTRGFDSNRRFSTDFPPPSYHEATSGWKLSNIARERKATSEAKASSTAQDAPDFHEVISE